MKIFKIEQVFDLLQFFPRSVKTSDKLWSTNYRDLKVESYPPKSTFSENYISDPRGAAPPNFYTR